MSILNFYNNFLFGRPRPAPMMGSPFGFPLGPPRPPMGGFFGMLNGFVAGMFCGLAMRARTFVNPLTRLYNRTQVQGGGIWGVPTYDCMAGLDTLSFGQNSLYLPNSSLISTIQPGRLANMPTGDLLTSIKIGSFTPYTPASGVSASSSVSSATGPEVPDGTSITVSGIDYSIFGSDAAEIKKLRPEMQKKVEKLYKYAKSKGWKMTLTCGYRSNETQRRIYNDWKAGRHKAPTVAAPGTSRHEFGCAVDIRINGKSEKTAEFNELGKYATSSAVGLRWGREFREDWHFDLNPKNTPKGRSGGSVTGVQSASVSTNKSSGSYPETSQSDYAAIYNGTYKGDYVKINGVTHFRYEDQNMGDTKAMKPAARAAFNRMIAAMKQETGLTLGYTTAYRGKSHQRQSLNNHTYTQNTMGTRFKSVAPMGYSEHHTGYACDITINGNGSRNNKDWTSNETLKKAYDWLRKNASRFGFEQSFTAGNAQNVGEEAWHWRYVGDADSQRVFYNARKFAGIVS